MKLNLHIIEPVERDTTLFRIQSTHNGGIIIQLHVNDSGKFQELNAIELGENYEVKPVSALKSTIRIVGILENIDLVEWYLLEQNKQQKTAAFAII